MEASSGCHAIIAAPFSRTFSFKTTNPSSFSNTPMSDTSRPGSASASKEFAARPSGGEYGPNGVSQQRVPQSPKLPTRVLQFDCKDNSAKMIKPTGRRLGSTTRLQLTRSGLPDPLDTVVVEIPDFPRKMKEVALFVDADTQQCFSMNPDHHGKSNVLLAKIHLERLHAKSRHINGLREVWVQNTSSLLCFQE